MSRQSKDRNWRDELDVIPETGGTSCRYKKIIEACCTNAVLRNFISQYSIVHERVTLERE